MKRVLFTLLVLAGVIGLIRVIQRDDVMAASPSAIYVFAGNDRTVCLGQSLLIQDLQATISGDVHDGDWITFGDGRFQPGNLQTVRYSTAQSQQIQYVPGVNDNALGYYRLMLLSDAPMGQAQERGSDEVRISFQTAPPLFCSGNFTIALNESCSQKVDVTMLQSNPVPPFTNYTIELYTKDGKRIADNILTKDHVGKEISYKLGHQCTSNFCYGSFFVDDYFPPLFDCKNDTVSCNSLVTPEALGFPFPNDAWIDTIIDSKFIIKDWDKCSDVTLEYTDTETKPECSGNADRIITRKWKAKDERGNTSNCTETIVIQRMSLDSVTFPVNFDGKEMPFFQCGDIFPTLNNGVPSPDTTGIPGVGYCGHLKYQYSDIVFEECGNTYKIARSWFVIDWCSSQSRTTNQLIYVKDTKGPEILAADTIRLKTGPYACASDQDEIVDLLQADDCSDFSISYELKDKLGYDFGSNIIWSQGKSWFKSLPTGSYTLKYIVTDACSNVSEATSVVIVHDDIQPYPVCKAHTKVSLDNSGNGRTFAFSFDNGSSDNCEIDYFKVRRMPNACGKSLEWNDFVDFCCEDIGTTQMVVFQVTDIYGNHNTCMVEVNVEDKIKPTIVCPPDITLACSDDYDPEDLDRYGKVVTQVSDRKDIVINNHYHQGIVGKDGLASDNCTVSVQYRYQTDISCHTGRIYRTFIATDANGNVDSCRQIITIANPNPFKESDINWPTHYIGDGCKILDADPAATGEPTFNNTACANVSSSYTDQQFNVADSACIKIFRTWSVIDWCQYDPDSQHNDIYQYIQTIKLSNNIPPIFVSSCQDTTYCSYVSDCGLTAIQLSADATDECTSKDELLWSYQVDINHDGVVDYIGNKSFFEADVPMGNHSITWTVSDQCGNTAQCVRKFRVKDCKKPTPICITSLTISLDAVTGVAVISAKDFDKGSSDNCTSQEDLWFTFDRAVPVKSAINNVHYFRENGIVATESEYLNGTAQRWDPIAKNAYIIFDCDDIANGISDTIMVNMAVTDQSGYSDYCTTELILQDNSNICPDKISSHFVSGRILTEDNRVVKGVEIRYKTTEADSVKKINENGTYHLSNLKRDQVYYIEPYHNGDPVEGVSAVDLVLIQRHILELAKFTSPYQYIAADVDNSKRISASDLTKIRKLILGRDKTFSNNRPSWVFVHKDGIDNDYPLQYDSLYDTGLLQSDMVNVDFVAVKLGDVNNSAPNDDFVGSQIESRKGHYNILYHKNVSGSQTKWTFIASEEITLDAIQMELLFQQYGTFQDIVWNDQLSMDYDANITGQTARMLMYHAIPTFIQAGNVLFELYSDEADENQDIRLSDMFKTGIFENGKYRPIVLSRGDTNLPKNTIRLRNNPVANQLVLDMTDTPDEQLSYEIIDRMGRIYMNGLIDMSYGQTDYEISLNPEVTPGIYFIRIRGQVTDTTLKFICVW